MKSPADVTALAAEQKLDVQHHAVLSNPAVGAFLFVLCW